MVKISQSRYLFIVDEKGDPGLAKGSSNKYVFGGYVVPEHELADVVSVWRQFKADVCGTPDVELKSEHFFASRSKKNPLIIRNRDRRREMAMRGFEQIFDIPTVAPLSYYVFKERASSDLIVESKRGSQKIDAEKIWVTPFALFALFLSNKHATGQVWWDDVSGEQEREKKNSEWRTLKTLQGAPPEIQSIDDEVLFLDSRENEAIQVADFLCRVLWQAMDGDEIYLARFIDKYDHKVRRDGLGIISIE